MPCDIPSPHPPPTKSPGQKISALLKGGGPAGRKLDVTELPLEHEIQHMDEARKFYTSDPPVFLSDYQKPTGTVNNACLAAEGTRALGARVSVISRAWSSRSVYQTIDLNGKRLIVKLFRGGTRGWMYKRWMGVIAGFEQQPIAYPVNEVREAKEARETGGRYSLPGDDSEWLDLVISDAKPANSANSTKSTKPAIAKPAIAKPVMAKPVSGRKRKSLPSFEDYSSDNSDDEFRPPKRVKDLNSTVATMNLPKFRPSLPRTSFASGAAAPNVKIEQEPGASKEHTGQPGPLEAPSISLLQPANTSYVESQGQASINNLSSRPTPSSNDKTSGHTPKSKQPSTTTTTTTSSSSSSKLLAISIPPPDPQDKCEELIRNFLASPPLTTPTTKTTSSVTQTDASSSFSSSSSSSSSSSAAAAAPILSPQKQATTILWVYLNSGEDYVPLYLRSCMTISRFFSCCLGAFELDEQPETVSALRVRLEPIPSIINTAAAGAEEVRLKQQGASWLVKRAVPDSFEILLEAVNKWAGWKDRESCAVKVEIILRAKK